MQDTYLHIISYVDKIYTGVFISFEIYAQWAYFVVARLKSFSNIYIYTYVLHAYNKTHNHWVYYKLILIYILDNHYIIIHIQDNSPIMLTPICLFKN